jgi:hypothetical protein
MEEQEQDGNLKISKPRRLFWRELFFTLDWMRSTTPCGWRAGYTVWIARRDLDGSHFRVDRRVRVPRRKEETCPCGWLVGHLVEVACALSKVLMTRKRTFLHDREISVCPNGGEEGF